jgi:hypothetical protein
MQMPGCDRDQFAFLKPNRLSVTVPYSLYTALEQRASLEGRSLSNLAAYLLENALGGRSPRG